MGVGGCSEDEITANSAQLKLELGLSLAIKVKYRLIGLSMDTPRWGGGCFMGGIYK